LRKNLPPHDFPTTPYPGEDYRSLYISHHPYWFLPRHKIWMSDEPHTGKLILCKFDPRRGCIEAYRLLGERGPSLGISWSYKPSVVIHSFNPRVFLQWDVPVLKLRHEIEPFRTKQGWWEGEIGFKAGEEGHLTNASFFLSRNIPERFQAPSMKLWPPRTIPGMPRVRAESQDRFTGRGHKPQSHDEISTTTFRTRHWTRFTYGFQHMGVRMGEEVCTWSTIDPALYTPTKEKPYQGIYAGDYAGHGVEFLLIMQTDKAPPPPRRQEPSSYFRSMLTALGDDDADEDMLEEWLTGQPSAAHGRHVSPPPDPEGIYQGAMEAVKLTGDPHIPRGEHTFIADDLGPGGFIRVADEHPFKGARVVRSRGHVAARGFQNGESQGESVCA